MQVTRRSGVYINVVHSSQCSRAPSDEGEVLVVSKAVGAFVLLEELSEILQVNFMKTLDVLTAGTRSLDDWDRLPH